MSNDHWLSEHILACSNTPIPQALLNDRIKIRAELLQLALRFVEQENVGLIEGLDRFVKGYMDRRFLIQPCVYDLIPKLPRITLLRWKKDNEINPGPEESLVALKTTSSPATSTKPKYDNEDLFTTAINNLAEAKTHLNNENSEEALVAIQQAEHNILLLRDFALPFG
ncbi:MAG: hypothetical protein ACI8WB_000188 [Phenylobacterium sp.]|jgi:hypothetical protein